MYLFTDLHISIVQRLKTTSILEGENCTFECHLSHDLNDEPSWTVNGQRMVANSHIQIVNNGRKYKMTIIDAVLSDAGDVVFAIKDLSCRTMLFVKGEQFDQHINAEKNEEILFIEVVKCFISSRETSAHLQGAVECEDRAWRGRRTEL